MDQTSYDLAPENTLTVEREAYSPYELPGVERYYATALENGRFNISEDATYVAPGDGWFEITKIGNALYHFQGVRGKFGLFEIPSEGRIFLRRKDGFVLEVEPSAVAREILDPVLAVSRIRLIIQSDGNLATQEGQIVIKGDPVIAAAFMVNNVDRIRDTLFYNRTSTQEDARKSMVQTKTFLDRKKVDADHREQKVLSYIVGFLKENPQVLQQLKAYVQYKKSSPR